MKKLSIIFLSCLSAGYILSSCSGNSETGSLAKAEFYVRGNCGMCEERIENTTKKIDGVKEADYNVETKMLKVSFDSTKANELNIHKAVAAVGHETKEIPMDEKAHEELPDCCKKGFAH